MKLPQVIASAHPRHSRLWRRGRRQDPKSGAAVFFGGVALVGGLALASEVKAQVLLPPPPPPLPEQAQTEQRLNEAERRDSGRGLQFVWLTPEVGFQWADLSLLSDSDLLDGDVVAADSMGPVLGGGAGLRFLYITGGARFRYALLNDFHLMSIGLEGALRIPMGNLEPYAFVGAGYLNARSFEAEDDVYALGTRAEDLAMHGLDARLGGGLDYFVTPVFSVGARLEADFTYLSRAATLAAGSGTIYSSDGSGMGLTTSAFVVLGLHF